MRLTLEPLDVERDLELLHDWVTHPRSVFWEMQDATCAEVAGEYQRIAEDPHHHAFLGRADGVPQFLVETYDPAHRVLADVAAVHDLLEADDVGMHLLVAPTDTPVGGFTRAVMRTVVDFCLADAPRVVVEPDVRNERIAALNAAVGFRVLREVDLGHKVAALSACARRDFEEACA